MSRRIFQSAIVAGVVAIALFSFTQEALAECTESCASAKSRGCTHNPVAQSSAPSEEPYLSARTATKQILTALLKGKDST